MKKFKLGEITEVEVEDFIKLAPKGLILQQASPYPEVNYYYEDGKHIYHTITKELLTGGFSNFSNKRNYTDCFVEVYTYNQFNNIQFRVLQVPKTGIRKKVLAN